MKASYTFIWVRGKHPCFLSKNTRYITILDIDGVLPVWSPEMERGEMDLGTFEMWKDEFKEKCGVYITNKGEIALDLPTPDGYKGKRGRSFAASESPKEGDESSSVEESLRVAEKR